MDRAQKEAVVGDLGQIFADSGVVVVAHYEGLTVAEMTDFRLRMKSAGGAVRVAKNKLAKIALKGTPGETMGGLLKGMTVLAYSEDPVAAAKVVAWTAPSWKAASSPTPSLAPAAASAWTRLTAK